MTAQRDRNSDPGLQETNAGPVSISPTDGELRPERRHSPSVTLHQGVVTKSYANCSWILRQTVGRLAVDREFWALSKLSASRHAPKVLGRPAPWVLKTEFVSGIPLEKLRPEDVDSDHLAQEADSLLNDLAEAGVCHGDIGHDHWQDMGREANLIWTDEKTLVAIDFGGAVASGWRLPLIGGLGTALRHHDELLLAKVQHHFPTSKVRTSTHTNWPLATWDLLRLLGKL